MPGANGRRGWWVGVPRSHCPSSWPALLQGSWLWPGFRPGGSPHSPKEPGGPRRGVQGYSVLSSLVGPACIFLRPSIAATQLVCTAARRLPLPCSSPFVGGED